LTSVPSAFAGILPQKARAGFGFVLEPERIEAVMGATLGKCPFCQLRSDGCEILSRESPAIEDHHRMHVPMGRVFIMDSRHKLEGVAESLF
jgi:hypothetical protein